MRAVKLQSQKGYVYTVYFMPISGLSDGSELVSEGIYVCL